MHKIFNLRNKMVAYKVSEITEISFSVQSRRPSVISQVLPEMQHMSQSQIFDDNKAVFMLFCSLLCVLCNVCLEFSGSHKEILVILSAAKQSGD